MSQAPGQFRAVVNLDADDGVRANHRALAALDADLRIPRRDLECQVSFLPFRCARGERPVAGEGADRQFVAAYPRRSCQARHARTSVLPERWRNFDLAGYLLPGIFTSNKCASVSSTACMFFFTTSSPFLP